MDNSLKAIRRKEAEEAESQLRAKCEAYAIEHFGGKEELMKLSNKHKGLWYLPVLDEEGEIDKLAVFKPIDRHILSYASTKVQDEGLYIFIEACMRECWINGDPEILDDDAFFLPAANQFNKIIDGKKAQLLKR